MNLPYRVDIALISLFPTGDAVSWLRLGVDSLNQ